MCSCGMKDRKCSSRDNTERRGFRDRENPAFACFWEEAFLFFFSFLFVFLPPFPQRIENWDNLGNILSLSTLVLVVSRSMYFSAGLKASNGDKTGTPHNTSYTTQDTKAYFRVGRRDERTLDWIQRISTPLMKFLV